MRRNPPDWMGHLDPSKKYSVSKARIDAVLDTTPKITNHFKPVGLWYACGLEWIDWLESEMPHWLDAVTHLYEVVPKYSSTNLRNFEWGVRGGGVLLLQSVAEVEMFTHIFGLNAGSRIEWPEVAAIWDGIEICPYQDDLRYAIDWYYPWDVASGCIWRPSGAVSLQLVTKL